MRTELRDSHSRHIRSSRMAGIAPALGPARAGSASPPRCVYSPAAPHGKQVGEKLFSRCMGVAGEKERGVFFARVADDGPLPAGLQQPCARWNGVGEIAEKHFQHQHLLMESSAQPAPSTPRERRCMKLEITIDPASPPPGTTLPWEVVQDPSMLQSFPLRSSCRPSL